MGNTIIPPLTPQDPKIDRTGVAQTQPPTTILDLLARPMQVMPEEESLNPLNATGYGAQVARESEVFSGEWFRNQAGRAARAFGDASINAVRGLTALASPAGRAVMQALPEVDTLDFLGMMTSPDPRLGDLAQVTRELQTERLGQTEIAGEAVGTFLSYATPTGPVGIAGKAGGMVGKAAIAPAERWAARQLARKLIDPERVAQLRASGSLLTEVAKAGEWGSIGRAAMWGGQRIVNHAPAYTALLAQSYASVPDDERAASLGHTALLGPLMLAIGRAGQWAGNRVAGLTLSKESKTALLEAEEALAAGAKNPTTLGRKWLQTLQFLPANATASIFEGAGFSLLDPETIGLIRQYADGDEDAGRKLFWKVAATTAGVLVTKHMVPHDAVPYFRRIYPELNDLRLQKDAARRKKYSEQQEAVLQGSAEAREQRDRATEQEFREFRDEAVEDPHGEMMVAATRPLHRSGWNPRQSDVESTEPSITYEFGTHSFEVKTPLNVEQPSLQVVVPARTWNEIQRAKSASPESRSEVLADPTQPKTEQYEDASSREAQITKEPVTLSGLEAARFIETASLVGATRRMQAELDLSMLGNKEVEAGGLWMGPFGAVQVDLDRSLLRHNLDGTKTPLPDVQLGGWAQGPGQPQYSSDKMIEIARIVAGKSQGWPEPIQDQAATAAITLGVFGQKTPSAQEVRLFIEGLPFDPTNPTTSPLMQRILTPDGMRRFSHELAMLGSGNSNFVDSLARMRKWAEQGPLQPDQPRQLTFTGERTPQPSETLADYLAEERMSWEGGAQAPEARAVENPTAAEQKPVTSVTPPAAEQPLLAAAKAEMASPRPDRSVVESYLDDLQSRQEKPLKVSVPDLAKQVAKALELKPSVVMPQVEAWVGQKAEARKASVVKAREDEGGFLDIFRRRERQPGDKPGNVVSRGVRYLFENIPENVARMGGPVGQVAGRDLARAFDRARQLRGGDVFDLQKAANKAIDKASPELNDTVQGPGASLYPRWVHQLEGRDQPTGEAAKEAVDAVDRIEKNFWQAAKAAKVARPRFDPTTDQVTWQLLEGEGGKVAIRMPGEDYAKVTETPALLKEYAEAVVADNRAAGMELKPETVESVLRETAYSPGDVTTFKRQAAFEKSRQWKRLPPMFRDSSGKVHKVLETDFQRYTERVVSSQADRIAAIENFGQSGITKADRERLGISRAGLEERLQDYAQAAGPDAAKLLESSIARLHGIGDKRDMLSETFDRLEGTRRSIETFSSGLLDFPSLFTVTSFGRMGTMLRAFGKAARHPFETLDDMRRLGALALDRSTTDLSDRHGFLEKIRDFATSFSRFTETVRQTLTGAYGKKIAEDMQAGLTKNKARIRETLEAFWPEKDRIEPMLNGEGTKAEYDRFVREFTKRATSQYRRGEGSQAHASRNVNRIFGYWRYFLGQSGLYLKHVARTYKTFLDAIDGKPGGVKQFASASQRLIGFTGRAAVAGFLNQLIGMVIREGATQGLDRFQREFLYNMAHTPAQTLATALGSQVVGGPIMSMWRGYHQPGMTPEQQVAAVAMPARVAAEAWAAATGRGPAYAGENPGERAITYAERAPLIPRIITTATKGAMAMVGAVDPAVGRAIRKQNEFMQTLGKAPHASLPDEQNAPLFYANKEIRDIIAQHSDEAPEQLIARVEPKIREALKLGEGEDIAASLKASRRMTDMKPAERDQFAEFAGKKALHTLYNYDRALDLISDHFKSEAGVPKDRTPFQETLAAAENQAQEFGAEDVWRNLREGVIDRAATAILDGDGIPTDEWQQLAVAMSRHPETLDKVLPAKEFVMLNSVPRAEAGLMMEALMLRSIKNAVRGRIAAEKREMRESAFLEMLK